MNTTSTEYIVSRAVTMPGFDADWGRPPWSTAQVANLRHFHNTAEASDHRPSVEAKLLHDDRGIYLHFCVQDRYVRCVHTERQSLVCKDSCVEWFVEPAPGRGYFNFEINAGGTLLLTHVFGDISKGECTKVSDDWLDRIRIHHTLPKVIEPEIKEPTTWHIEAFAPFDLFRAYLPDEQVSMDRPWRCNFYKCGDRTSHPHWASWQPVDFEHFGFHDPGSFAPITFA